MSRIPQPSSSRSLKQPSTPIKKVSSRGSPIKARAQPGARAATPVKSKIEASEVVPQTPSVPLSIKEVIALKRAEAKKGQAKAANGPLDSFESLEDALPNAPSKQEDDILGRLSVRETIERARSTGENQSSTLCRAELNNKGSSKVLSILQLALYLVSLQPFSKYISG
jgi:hypothetical protein